MNFTLRKVWGTHRLHGAAVVRFNVARNQRGREYGVALVQGGLHKKGAVKRYFDGKKNVAAYFNCIKLKHL